VRAIGAQKRKKQGADVKKLLVLVTTVGAALTLVGASGAGGSGRTQLAGGTEIPMIRAVGHSSGTVHGLPTISVNWSGYAAEAAPGTKFDYVSSEFIQPAVNCSSGQKFVNTSNWVGLDGFENQTVEQDGTDGYCAGSGNHTAKYYAWIDMYPLPEVNPFAVSPGDVISTLVKSTPSGTFTLTVTDLTSGKTKTQVADGPKDHRASAEWIIERPGYCNSTYTKCFVTPLANFGTTEMTKNVAGLQGHTPVGLGSMPSASTIFMIQDAKDGGFYSLVNVSGIDKAANAFFVRFLHSGRPSPIKI
jgi:hypothetical protein